MCTLDKPTDNIKNEGAVVGISVIKNLEKLSLLHTGIVTSLITLKGTSSTKRNFPNLLCSLNGPCTCANHLLIAFLKLPSDYDST